jgi:hypothetical protein
VGYHHVAIGAGRFVETGTFAKPQRFGDVDLHVVDEHAVPDRLEESVREAERKDVLRRLFAQEMVDAKDLVVQCASSTLRAKN